MSKKQLTDKATEKPTHGQINAMVMNDPMVLNTELTSAIIGNTLNGEAIDNAKNRDFLNASIARVQRGDMSDMEAMLVSQSQSLQALFFKYTLFAGNTDNMKHIQQFFNMAMKAQAQCRATIEALTALKYPKQVIVTKQANITQGNQQVNNGMGVDNLPSSTRTHAHAQKNTIEQNELLEVDNGTKTMDASATLRTSAENKDMATVATQHRRKNSRG